MECVCVCLFIYWESAQDVITKEIRIYRLKNKRKKQKPRTKIWWMSIRKQKPEEKSVKKLEKSNGKYYYER